MPQLISDAGTLGRRDGVPLYVRLAGSLRARVSQGEWKVGDRIPTFDELAANYGVALNTVRKAVETLVSEGLLQASRGRGTVVRSSESQTLDGALRLDLHSRTAHPMEMGIEILEVRNKVELPPPLRAPNYKVDAIYAEVLKTHTVRGVPYGFLDIFVSADVYRRFPRGAIQRQKITRLLLQVASDRVQKTRQQMTIVYADERLAKILGCTAASPLVRIRRWMLGRAGEVLLAGEIFYLADTFIWDVTEDEKASRQIVPTVRA